MSPEILVSKIESMSDEPIEMCVKGLTVNQHVTLHSYTEIDNRNAFECVAQFVADKEGCINLQSNPCIGGSYRGVEPMGLFWAMEPSLSNKQPYARFAKIDVTTPLVVTIRVYGDVTIKSIKEVYDLRVNGKLDGVELASFKVNRLYMSPGTRRIKLSVKEHGLHGALFIPPGKEKFPAVIVMFGGAAGSGTLEFKASLLASHGFVALALGYTGRPDPDTSENIYRSHILDMGYFERAVDFLLNFPEVNKSVGVGVVSISSSTVVAQAMSCHIKAVKCVICVNCNLWSQSFSIACNSCFYDREKGDVGELFKNVDSKPFSLRYHFPHYGRYHYPNLQNTIMFYENRSVAFLFIAGLSDEHLLAEYSANFAERLLKNARHPNFTILRYAGAGHLIELPYGVHNESTRLKGFNAVFKWGGLKHPHCKAQEDSWEKQIRFLKSNL